MFFLARNGDRPRELLTQSRNLISGAKKVLKYRKHLLNSAAISSIEDGIGEIKKSTEAGNFSTLLGKSKNLHSLLQKHGGDIFPVNFLNGNTEVLFVAIFLAIAIRTFFVQSFQIPTNSMHPTYYGMTHRLMETDDSGKHFFKKILHKIRFCGKEISVMATGSGEISIPLMEVEIASSGDRTHIVPYEIIRTKKWGLIPTRARKYTLFVGSGKYHVLTPLEFSLDKVLLEKFYGKGTTWKEAIARGDFISNQRENFGLLQTGCFLKSGEKLLHFEILPGDMLFVDKISYHFRAPKPGESIVFRTDDIEAFAESPKFFIKRLIGQPGDVLSIKNNKIFANGNVLLRSEILVNLNTKAEGYSSGYIPKGSLANGKKVSVPNGQYFVLGDNSNDSYDSRFWGFVPRRSICGRPLLIFYPFGSRFGKCR
ncbi:MAG: signal peptidase I [Puniceicoccales bacterium]|jgi:signal peptidase I|nr:signal peptidase I [Puniceicoccales bacterium]